MAEAAGTIRIALIGRHAACVMAGLALRPGVVFAAFERSLYLCENATGALACLGPMSIGAGPLNALAPDWPALRFRAGDHLTPTGAGCRLPGGPVIEIGAARLYAPSAGPIRVTRPALEALADKAARYARADGLAPLAVRGRAASSPLLDRAAPGIDALAAWLGRGAAEAPPGDAIERLVGLGPGLTPSGDDFLGGMMIALRAAASYAAADRLAGAVMARARRATGRISLSHLAAAAGGEGAAALHETLAALDRMDDAALDAGLAAIDRIGHSSGWDALAGAVLALGTQPDSRAAASSAASALDAATHTPAARRIPI